MTAEKVSVKLCKVKNIKGFKGIIKVEVYSVRRGIKMEPVREPTQQRMQTGLAEPAVEQTWV